MGTVSKVGIIGLGNISTRHRKNLKELFPNVKIGALSASGRPIGNEVINVDVNLNNIKELIAFQPEFVIDASPASLHAEHSIALLEAGISVLIEKPLSNSASEAEKIINSLPKGKCYASVGYCLRYMPSTEKIKELINDELLGQIYNVHASVGQFLPDWRPSIDYRKSVSASCALGGGVLMELSHEFDYLRWLFGDLKFAYGLLRNTDELDVDVEEIADIVLIANDSVVCTVHLDFIQKHPRRECSIIGEKGRLDWDLVSNTVVFYSKTQKTNLYEDAGWDKNNMYLRLISDFVNQISGKVNSCVDIADACETQKLIDSIKTKSTWR